MSSCLRSLSTDRGYFNINFLTPFLELEYWSGPKTITARDWYTKKLDLNAVSALQRLRFSTFKVGWGVIQQQIYLSTSRREGVCAGYVSRVISNVAPGVPAWLCRGGRGRGVGSCLFLPFLTREENYAGSQAYVLPLCCRSILIRVDVCLRSLLTVGRGLLVCRPAVLQYAAEFVTRLPYLGSEPHVTCP